MTTANAVARYLQQQRLTGDVQLQKLLYYSQAWALTWTGKPLFDEPIEAWEGGPVVQSVWSMVKHGDIGPDRDDLTDDQRAIVDAVYAFYGRIGGARLSRLTHGESPWKDAWNGGRGRNSVIELSAIRREYTEKALLEPKSAPTAPILTSKAARRDVRAVAEQQRKRWRPLLDRLAKQ